MSQRLFQATVACVLLLGTTEPTPTVTAAAVAQLSAGSAATEQVSKDDLFAQLDPTLQRFAQGDWSAYGQNIAQDGLNNDDVARLLDMLTSNRGQIARTALDYPDPAKLKRGTVGEFVFVDLDRDGSLELVATSDYTQAGLFNDLLVVRRTRDNYRFDVQQISSYRLGPLASVIVDADGDRNMELVITTLLTSGRAGEPQVVWPAVYALSSSLNYSEQSTRFGDYYRHTVLPQLDQQIKSLIASNARPYDLLVVQLERDKVLRLTDYPAAGLWDAQWRAGSVINRDRLLAVAVLRDIGLATGGNQATIPLMSLGVDWDPRVNEDANAALKEISSRWQ